MADLQFQSFLQEFIPQISKKSAQLNRAVWLLETVGSSDAANLKAELDAELRILLSDPKIYQKIGSFQDLKDPLLIRQKEVLLRTFKQNLASPELLEEIAKKEADLSMAYASFRAEYLGKKVSENDIRAILASETDIEKREKAWEASKEIGKVLAPKILDLVRLRNRIAKSLGYDNYFMMQLDLQEVDEKWLVKTFDELDQHSSEAFLQVMDQINRELKEKFHINGEVPPSAWSDPFCQEDPLGCQNLDSLVQGIDLVERCRSYYQEMGMDVGAILKRSDLYEREGKCPHAFCIHIDREGDVRTLNNVRPTIKWLETVLHELGHAVYDERIDPNLPWLLREPPHMITTEAMALLAGRQAYKKESLRFLVGDKNSKILDEAEKSLKRRQLIFSRWVLVMTEFEKELYQNPDQDLNQLWWGLVEKYQKITPPKDRKEKFDWACKYHIGLAPVYYFSYLLGEMFASSIQVMINDKLRSPEAGNFLTKHLFLPGNQMAWHELIEQVIQSPFQAKSWILEFCS